MLSEYVTKANESCVYATETFDQPTGKVTVVRKAKSATCGDDDVTWASRAPRWDFRRASAQLGHRSSEDDVPGVESARGQLLHRRLAIPLQKDRRDRSREPRSGHVDERRPGLRLRHADGDVFGTDVAKNTVGPVVQITSIPWDRRSEHIEQYRRGCRWESKSFGPPSIAHICSLMATVSSFQGIGSGNVQGLAVDSADGIAVTTTYGDFRRRILQSRQSIQLRRDPAAMQLSGLQRI